MELPIKEISDKIRSDLDKIKGKTVVSKKLKKKVVKSAATGAVATGVFLSGLFGSPAELTDNSKTHINEKPAIVQMVDMDTYDDEETYEDIYDRTKKRKGFADRVKERVLELPVALRAVLGVPLWTIGWGITTAVGAIWGASKIYIIPFVIKLLLIFVVLLAVVFAVIKALHPDWPAKKILKKMFKKKRILYTIIGTIILTVIDTILLLVWKEYNVWRWIIIFVIGIFVLFIILRPFIAKAIKKRR